MAFEIGLWSYNLGGINGFQINGLQLSNRFKGQTPIIIGLLRCVSTQSLSPSQMQVPRCEEGIKESLPLKPALPIWCSNSVESLWHCGHLSVSVSTELEQRKRNTYAPEKTDLSCIVADGFNRQDVIWKACRGDFLSRGKPLQAIAWKLRRLPSQPERNPGLFTWLMKWTEPFPCITWPH